MNDTPHTEFTHAVVYDAADNHGIRLEPTGRVAGCDCGFICEEWDEEGDTLVAHLRHLGPPNVTYIDLTGPRPAVTDDLHIVITRDIAGGTP